MSSDPPAELVLRPIADADEPLLLRIYSSTREEELAATSWTRPEKDAFLRQQFLAQHRHYTTNYPGARLDVVELGGTAVGRLYVARGREEIRIVDIAILPEYRGRGIGTRLLRSILIEADEAGLTTSIHVEMYNPARHLYERLGFAAVGEHGVYLRMERAASVNGRFTTQAQKLDSSLGGSEEEQSNGR